MKISKATACTIAGMIGVAVTGFLAFKAGQKSVKEKKPEKETKKEKVIRVAKTYGPAVAAGIATEAVIFAGDRIHVKEELGLATAVAAANHVVNVQKKVTKELVGEEKAKEIDETVKERLKPELIHPSELANAIHVYEPYTEQYIWTTREAIAWVMLDANKKFHRDGIISLNYIIKGLGGKPKEKGEVLVWSFDSEIQGDAWDYYGTGGPWIEIQPIVSKIGPEQVFELCYTVEPTSPYFEDKLYREATS